MIAYPNSISTYSQTKADMESRIWVEYEKIIQAKVDASVIGDYSNKEVGPELSRDISAWYNWIITLNRNVENAIVYNNSWFDCFVYDWPHYPDLITQEDIQKVHLKITKNVQNMEVVPILNLGE